MSKYALLLRLSPIHWPTWERTIVPDTYTEVWFKTGRRRAEDISPGIPVVVLAIKGLGVVGYGKPSRTSSVAVILSGKRLRLSIRRATERPRIEFA